MLGRGNVILIFTRRISQSVSKSYLRVHDVIHYDDDPAPISAPSPNVPFPIARSFLETVVSRWKHFMILYIAS